MGHKSNPRGVARCRQRPPVCAPYHQARAVGGSLRSRPDHDQVAQFAVNEIDRGISSFFRPSPKGACQLELTSPSGLSLVAPLAPMPPWVELRGAARSSARSPEGSTPGGETSPMVLESRSTSSKAATTRPIARSSSLSFVSPVSGARTGSVLIFLPSPRPSPDTAALVRDAQWLSPHCGIPRLSNSARSLVP